MGEVWAIDAIAINLQILIAFKGQLKVLNGKLFQIKNLKDTFQWVITKTTDESQTSTADYRRVKDELQTTTDGPQTTTDESQTTIDESQKTTDKSQTAADESQTTKDESQANAVEPQTIRAWNYNTNCSLYYSSMITGNINYRDVFSAVNMV